MVFYFGVSPALSVPVAPGIHQLKQTDGSMFMAMMWGDEWVSGWETIDGYSIIFDETTQDWTYAIPDADGNLVSSAKGVGKKSPPDNVPKHIRPAGKAQSEILYLKDSMASGVPDRVVLATGTANIPVILIKFNDKSTNYTAADFNNHLFGSGTNSMKDYYVEVSYGKFNVSPGPSGVAGWYTASKNHDYYGYNQGWKPAAELVREAVRKADAAGFDFSSYDNNHDGYVDVVSIVHSGPGRESTLDGTNIHSHRFSLTYGGVGAYTTKSGKIVDDYVIQPETQYGSLSTIGVFVHEYSHALGVPDLYDGTGTSEGVGLWSLMGNGCWNGISMSGDMPAQLDAWSKSLLGWVSPIQVSTSSSIQITRVEDNSVVYQILDNPNNVNDWISGIGKGEYFLVENRQKTGFDVALPGEGLLIWHIDESVTNNNDKTHKLVNLEESDGKFHLDNNYNSGDAFDPWYNNIVGFTETTTPNSNLYTGGFSGVRVTKISGLATTMTATLGGLYTPDFTPPTISITTPTPNQIVTTTTLIVNGTALDNDDISKVEVKVGTGPWQMATGTRSWSKSVTLASDSNTITVRATDAAGNTKDVSVIVTYIADVVPIASFTGAPTTGTAPLTVTFTDSSTNNPTIWNWSFGDGNFSTVQNPVRVYETTGIYTVSLKATNSGGSTVSMKTNYITVRASPSPTSQWTANITITSGTLIQNLTFGTNEAGTDGYDAGLDNLAPPAPPSPRNDYYLFIDDPLFDRLYGDIRFIVNATNSERIWKLYVLSKDNDMVLNWNISRIPQDISCTLNVSNHDYDMKQVSSVTLTKSAGYYPVTITARYIPPADPIANFTANITTGTSPLTVQFTDTSTGSPTAWNWSFGDGAFSIVQHPVHVYETPGFYTVNLTAINAGGSNVSVKTNYITVNPALPSTNFTANVTNGITPMSVMFTDTSTGSIASWNWSFGDGVFSIVQNPVHVYRTPGIYTVSLTVTNAGGSNVSTKANYITVRASPSPTSQWTANITIISGALVQNLTFGTNKAGTDGYDAGLDILAPPAPPSPRNDNFFSIDDPLFDRLFGDMRFIVNATNTERNWALCVLSKDNDMVLIWDISGVPQDISCSLNVSNHDYDMKQIPSVTLTKSASYYTVTITARYSPPASPLANFTANVTSGLLPRTIRFTDTSGGFPTGWLWNFGDGTNATSQNPVHTYGKAGNQTVSLTASNACGSNTTVKEKFITIYPKGDFNHNWEVDIGDVALVAYMVVNRAPSQIPDADFNANGFVDIGDAGKIAYFVVEKIHEL